MKPLAAILACILFTNCAAIHRHPKATALIVGAAIAIPVGIKLGYRKPCPSFVNGYPYNGGPICPTSCDRDGCYWGPGKK